MSLMKVTAETLSRDLEKEVPEVYVVIAKHQAAGMDADSIADIIGCEPSEINEATDDPVFKEVRQIIGALAAQTQADQPFIWDALEATASRRLLDRVETERDPEFLLKVAATANKMTRRSKLHDNGILDPSRSSGRAAVTLTSRMVQRITAEGHREIQTERKLSIHDGSMSNPSFEEVGGLLAGNQGLKPAKIPVQQENALMEELNREMEARLK